MNQHLLPSDIVALAKSCRRCHGVASCRVPPRPPRAICSPRAQSAPTSFIPIPRASTPAVKVVGGGWFRKYKVLA